MISISISDIIENAKIEIKIRKGVADDSNSYACLLWLVFYEMYKSEKLNYKQLKFIADFSLHLLESLVFWYKEGSCKYGFPV